MASIKFVWLFDMLIIRVFHRESKSEESKFRDLEKLRMYASFTK